MPSSDFELSNIKNTLEERLHSSELICHCISKLKPGKGDGSEGFKSDHFINAGKRLNVLLSLLFSILSNVDNNRGISLFNSIAKVFEYVNVMIN